MLLDDKPYTLDRIFRLFAAAALLTGAVLLLRTLADVLLPFAAALLLAYLANPAVRRIERLLGGRRMPAVLLFLLAAGLVLAGLGWLVLPAVARETAASARLLAQAAADSQMAEIVGRWLPADIWGEIRSRLGGQDVQELLRSGRTWSAVQTILGRVAPGLWNVVSGAAGLLLGVVGLTAVLIYLLFLLADFERLAERWGDWLPPAWRGPVTGFMAEFEDAMSRYFRAQSLVAATVGVLHAAGFALIGLPFAVPFGLLVGLLNMVPYLQLAALPPALFLALLLAASGGVSIAAAIGLTALVFAVIQLVQEAVLVPRLVGGATGLPPWLVLLCLSVWGQLLGLLGLLIAIPATCLVLAWYRRYLAAQNATAPGPQTLSGD